MKICLIAEGSFPYVTGGVSSWVNNLIKSCPEHEFHILAITPDYKEKGKYKYKLPDNVVGVSDIFLNSVELDNGKKGRHIRLKKEETAALYNLLNSKSVDWDVIFNMFYNKRFSNITEFFMSRNFYNLVQKLYIENYPYTPYTDFLWTMRSMYLMFFYILFQDIPEADIYMSVSAGYSGIVGAYAKSVFKKPFLLCEHGIYTREREEEIIKASWVKGYYKDLWIRYFYNFSDCAYQYADLVTTLFEGNRKLQVELGCYPGKLRIVPNGVKVENFHNINREKEDPSKYYIGAIIRLVPIKDIKTMIKAFDIVKRELPNAEFYIMGPTEEDEDYYEECLDLIKFLDLKDVHITGTIDIRDYIGKMDVMTLTSISEGQPLSVMEGMAAKKAHVCTNVGDCRDLLLNTEDLYGQAGYIMPIMDHEKIAEGLIKLCKDKSLRDKMGEAGYRRIMASYQFNFFIEEFKKIFNELKLLHDYRDLDVL